MQLLAEESLSVGQMSEITQEDVSVFQDVQPRPGCYRLFPNLRDLEVSGLHGAFDSCA